MMQKRVHNGDVTNRYAKCVTQMLHTKGLINKAIIDIRLPDVTNRYAEEKVGRYALRTP